MDVRAVVQFAAVTRGLSLFLQVKFAWWYMSQVTKFFAVVILNCKPSVYLIYELRYV